jgi:hypothetical protein
MPLGDEYAGSIRLVKYRPILSHLAEHMRTHGAWGALSWLSRAFPVMFWDGLWKTLLVRHTDAGAANTLVEAIPETLYREEAHMRACHEAFGRWYQSDEQLEREGVSHVMWRSGIVLVPRDGEIEGFLKGVLQ